MKKSARKGIGPMTHSFGEVDLFGLDEFGQVPGLAAMWGGAIGAGVGTGTAIAVRQLMKPAPGAAPSALLDFAELIGMGAAVLTGGIMYAFPGTRNAGMTAALVGIIDNGLRFAEQKLAAPAAPALNGWFGEVVPTVIPSLGGYGNLGIVTPQVVPTLGQHQRAGIELVGPPSLAGMDSGFAQHPGAAQVRLLGGPPISAIGSHFGATLFG